MPWAFTEHHVRPNVFYFSPQAHKERLEVKQRRHEATVKFKQAKVLLDGGGYGEAADAATVVEAEHLLELAVAAWPDNATMLLTLADCIAHRRRDPERALGWYDQLVEASDSPPHRMARARAFAALGWLEEALQDMESALAADPHNGAYLKDRGAVQERLGHTFDATLDYSAALPLLREAGLPTADATFNRGYCQRLLGNTEEAIRDFEQALQQAPSITAIKTTLGCMYLHKRRYKDALDLFTVVMTFRGHSAAAANNVALAQYLLATAEEDGRDRKALKAAAPQGGTRRTATSSGQDSTPRLGGQDQGDEAGGQGGALPLPARRANDDEMSDNDNDEAADFDAMLAHSGKANEDPRQWALSVIRGGARKAAGSEPAQRALLESSLRNFNTAMHLYMDEPSRVKAQAPSDGEVHAVHENEPVAAHDGYLLMLTNKVRVPGSPVVHDREIEDGEIQYNRGLVHLVLGNLQQAEQDFQDALHGNPTHAHYPHYRAVVHGRKGELKDAVKWNQAALTLNPNYFPALYHLGLCLYLQSRNAEAIQRLDAALALQPRNWAVMEARGRVLQELDRHAEALPALKDALYHLGAEEPPECVARLHFAIAQSAIATHQPDLLRSSLRNARLNGKDPASVYALRGLLAHREGKLGKALAYMGRAIKLAPQEARYLFDRSQVKLDLLDWQGAVDDMSEALQRLPDAASLHYSRGMALYSMKEHSRALLDLEEAAHLVLQAPVPHTPTSASPVPPSSTGGAPPAAKPAARGLSPLAQQVLNKVNSRTGSVVSHSSSAAGALDLPPGASPTAAPPRGAQDAPPADPAELLRRWASPDSPSQSRQLQQQAPGEEAAGADGAKGQRSGSVGGPAHDGATRGVLRPDPRLWEGSKFMSNAASPPDLTPSLWYHLGICRARQGGWTQAAAAFERAVMCLPRHPVLLHELAKAFQAIGDHRAAVERFTQVLALQPGNARALFRRGLSHHALKAYESAAADLEAAKRLDPDNVALRVDYRTLHLSQGLEALGQPGEEAMVWDAAAFPPGIRLPA